MKKINIEELLKYCPSGMELDSTICTDLYFDFVDDLGKIHCFIQRKNHRTGISFYPNGTLNNDPQDKCVIFPKGKTTWEGFVPPCKFKDGDIVHMDFGDYNIIAIFKKIDKELCYYYVDLKNGQELQIPFSKDNKGIYCTYYVKEIRFATEEEKEKLFNTIKDNGYRWDPETKNLEKLIEPNFKVGDMITNGKISITIGYIDDEYYYEFGGNIANRIFIKNQTDWKLVTNKFDISSLKPFINEWNLPEGFEFTDENGNVINATKIVLTKKNKEYPKTYEECCKIMGVNHTNDLDICEHCDYKTEITYYEDNLLEKIEALYRLIICRDAYWKIVGEEMGLGKPWEPDDSNYITGRYCIFVYKGNIICDTPAQDCIFTFPSAEMRDAFKENFDKDLEFCKELL